MGGGEGEGIGGEDIGLSDRQHTGIARPTIVRECNVGDCCLHRCMTRGRALVTCAGAVWHVASATQPHDGADNRICMHVIMQILISSVGLGWFQSDLILGVNKIKL